MPQPLPFDEVIYCSFSTKVRKAAEPSVQHGLLDSFWEGLSRRPLGKANNKPTDNRHIC